MKKHVKIWQGFNEFLFNCGIEALTKEQLFKIICKWVSNQEINLGSELCELYALNSYIRCNPFEYPIESSDDDVSHMLGRISRFKPSSVDSILMFIRDILWNMIAYKSSIECSNCRDDDFRVLYDEKLNKIVLCCDLCGYSELENGDVWCSDSNLVPAKTVQLKNYGYID